MNFSVASAAGGVEGVGKPKKEEDVEHRKRDPSQKEEAGKSWALAYNRLPEKQSRVEQQDKGLWKRFHKKEKIRKIRLSDVIKYLENIYDR